MMKALAYLTIVCASICCLSTYAAEIQAIPKAFHGKWVGHIDKQLTPQADCSCVSWRWRRVGDLGDKF